MHPEDLMKPDLFTEIALLGSGTLIFALTVADRGDCAYSNLTAKLFWRTYAELFH